MAGYSPSGKALYKKLSLADQVVLAVAKPLPESMSLRSLAKFLSEVLSVAITVLVFCAPVAIVTMTWCCLESMVGHNNTPLQVPFLPWISAAFILPQPTLPTALSLLGIVSTITHVSYSALQQLLRQRYAGEAAALTADHWKLRPVVKAATSVGCITSSEGLSIRIGPMINTKGQISRPGALPFSAARTLVTSDQQTAVANVDSNNHKVAESGAIFPAPDPPTTQPLPQQVFQRSARKKDRDTAICFVRLREFQVLLFGENHAADWCRSTPQTFENAVFETGRLCGLVGVAAPFNGGAGTVTAVYEMLSQLSSVLAA